VTVDVAERRVARRRVLDVLKRLGPTTLTALAGELGTTHEAARLQVNQLVAGGEVTGVTEASGSRGGRPARRFSLTQSGEHAFPKRYGDLASLLLDTVGERLGAAAVRDVLDAAVDAKVDAWRPALAGLVSLPEKLEALRSIYIEDDPWIEVTEDDGRPMLVERNCPYLDVALSRPALCSLTVNSLSRLLGRRVERVRRFQDGDGLCAFLVHDDPVAEDAPLRLEGE
jgi:predicted ArsR family transcriptional regulator